MENMKLNLRFCHQKINLRIFVLLPMSAKCEYSENWRTLSYHGQKISTKVPDFEAGLLRCFYHQQHQPAVKFYSHMPSMHRQVPEVKTSTNVRGKESTQLGKVFAPFHLPPYKCGRFEGVSHNHGPWSKTLLLCRKTTTQDKNYKSVL